MVFFFFHFYLFVYFYCEMFKSVNIAFAIHIDNVYNLTEPVIQSDPNKLRVNRDRPPAKRVAKPWCALKTLTAPL